MLEGLILPLQFAEGEAFCNCKVKIQDCRYSGGEGFGHQNVEKNELSDAMNDESQIALLYNAASIAKKYCEKMQDCQLVQIKLKEALVVERVFPVF